MNLVPQFGFVELVVVAIVALVVVGPKDLPKLMRQAGRIIAQIKRMGGEFTSAFEQMARDTEMEEMRKEIETLKRDNVFVDAKRSIDDAMAPVESAVRSAADDVRAAQAASPAGAGGETAAPKPEAGEQAETAARS